MKMTTEIYLYLYNINLSTNMIRYLLVVVDAERGRGSEHPPTQEARRTISRASSQQSRGRSTSSKRQKHLKIGKKQHKTSTTRFTKPIIKINIQRTKPKQKQKHHRIYERFMFDTCGETLLAKLLFQGGCLSRSGSELRLRPLPFLLVAHTSRLRLKITNVTQVIPDGACTEGVGLRAAAVFLVGGAEAADEGIEAAPRLAERAGTRRRRVGKAEERARVVVNLGLPELVEVVEEFEHVRAAAQGKREWWTVVP